MNITTDMKIKRIIIWLLQIAAAILFLSFIFGMFLYRGADPLFLPSWVHWEQEDMDLQIDGEPIHVTLKKRCLTISDPQGKQLWTAPDDWKVSQVWIRDIDHDELDEVVFLLWKKGSFGDHKPFWIEENDENWSQHIFIYDWDHERKDRLKPLWMSSAMGIQAAKVQMDEQDRLLITTPEGKRTTWYWESWGLLLAD
ncbi:MAG: hypothetical protein K6A77_11005 [Clostridiales bacterium]|nr:hypothetical protein [Clostridiales bacterium]